jgi:hypothetical protein
MIRQNVLLSNANKSNVYNLNNDIYLNFPTNLFFRPPKFIELLNMDLNAEINLFGNTNNSLLVIYKNITHLIVVEFSTTLKTDYQLSLALKYALNNPRDPDNPNILLPYSDNDLIFDVTESSIENVVTNYKIEREAFTTAFTIKTNNKQCIIDFNIKDSIGPIIGLGNGTYTLPFDNEYQISGTSTQSISAYNYIDIINSSGTTSSGELAGPYPNYNDVNCKMVLYDSNKRIIPNKYKQHDTTISLNTNVSGMSQYENIGEVLDLIEEQLNDYSSYFTPNANFLVAFDNNTEKVTIKNTTGAKFGIGFDFSNITRDRIMTSTNSIDWLSKASINNNDWRSVAYGNISGTETIVAVASSGIGDRIMITTNGVSNWSSIQSPNDNYWSSLAYHFTILPDNTKSYQYVTVASSGLSKRAMYSTDSLNWTYTDCVNNNWTSVCYGGTSGQEKFVAVASSGIGNRAMTSIDGITWVSQLSASNNDWTSVCWGGIAGQEKFVAVSSTGVNDRVMTSSNGLTWISRTSASNNNWTSVCWGGISGQEKFVAVSNTGMNNRVMTSSDGIVWTSQTSASNNNWTSICWSNTLKLFVAVANSGTGNRVMTSSNGILWTSRISSTDNNWGSITWSTFLNLFIVTTNDKSNVLMVSSNGFNWNTITISIEYEWNNIISTDQYLLASGISIGRAIDSYKWNNLSFYIDNNWTSVCFGGITGQEQFVAVADSGVNNRVMTSTNGINWMVRQSAADYKWSCVCWGGIPGQEKFVAVASSYIPSTSGSNNRVMTSADGITWTLRTTPADNEWNSICWSSNLSLFVAIASSGTGNRVMTSADGITWFSQISAADYNWTSVCYGGISGQEKFVAVASSGIGNRVMTSTDGITWILQNSAADNNWTSICWTGLNKFVAVANSGMINRIMTSLDGITWVAYNSPNNMDWNEVIWVSGSGIYTINSLVAIGSSFGNTSGSLHYILGLEQKSYFDLTEIISLTDILCYERIFADDFVLVCSNIVNNATDLNVIGIGNADNIKSNNIIFAIPLSQSKHFKPIDSSYYRINISASSFSLGYKNKKFNSTNPNLINFYLRLLSGRHITCTSQFTMQLSFLF